MRSKWVSLEQILVRHGWRRAFGIMERHSSEKCYYHLLAHVVIVASDGTQ